MLKNLKLVNFRNYADERIDFDPRTNILVGANGQGKTNILEAIYFLSMLRSFRTASPREIRRLGAAAFHISAFITSSRGYDKLLEIDYAETRRLRVDSAPVFKASEFIGAFKSVAFLPSDLMIVTQGAALRRRFLNMLLCSFDTLHLADLNDYANALKTRNNLLKATPSDTASLAAFERILAEKAVAITKKRSAALKTISNEMSALFKTIKGDSTEFEIAYSPHPATNDVESHAAKLAADRAKDAARRATTLGPHLDDFQLILDGKPLRAFGSTGQCRLAALCLKLAAVKLLNEAEGGATRTVALVDDVAGELDGATRDAFFETLSQTEQAFFTFTEPPGDSYFSDAKILEVRAGSVAARQFPNSE